jgi:formylglycine-generating enzyme required for sulfatase activity
MTGMLIALIALQTADLMPYTEKIPNSVVSFEMMPVPAPAGKSPLYMAKTEITWDVFDIWAFRLDLTQEQQATGVDASARPSKPYGAPDRGFGHAGYPALAMTSFAAEEFCRWLSRKTGKKYRLPTETEWAWAAAGGSSNPVDLDAIAWYWDNSDDKTQPVARKKANPWGLFDMVGNVQEWVTTGPSAYTTCGGSFLTKKPAIGISAREAQSPRWNESDPQNPKSKWWLANGPFVGFRVVHVPSEKSL